MICTTLIPEVTHPRVPSAAQIILYWLGYLVGDRTEPCGTPLLIGLGEEQWPSTTAAIERSERKLEMKQQSER